MNVTLTGIKDTDLLILQRLDDKDLTNLCQVNSYTRSLCANENFWINRLVNNYGQLILSKKQSTESYKDFYIRIKPIISMCRDLVEVASAQLVADDLYNSNTGIINVRAPELINYLLLKIANNYMNKIGQHNEAMDDFIRSAYMNVPDWNRDMVSITANLTDKDIGTFYTIINIGFLGRPQIILSLKRNKREESIELNKRNPLHEYAQFLIYIHTGIAKKKLPFDITWDKLCSTEYILNYKN